MNRTKDRMSANLLLGALALALASPCLGEFKATEANVSVV